MRVHTARIGNCLRRSMLMYFVLCRPRVHWWWILTASQVVLTTVHSEKDERWLRRAPVLADFVVHCALPRDSKLEKGSKKGTSTGVPTGNVLLCKWSEQPGFSWFFPNSVLWGQNLAEILFLLWLALWKIRLQKHNWKSIPWGLPKK